MSASLPSVASLPSLPPFVHSKLTALPALDMEHDRLARACGQGPVFTFRSDCVPSSSRSIHRAALDASEASSSSTSASPPKAARTSSELRANTTAPPAPLNLDDTVLSMPFELGWGLRPRATSVRVSARHGASASGCHANAGAAGGAGHLPHRPRSASQPASIPVFCPSSPRGVLRSLRDVLDLEGMQLEECLDVRQVFERWEKGLARCEAVQQQQPQKIQKTFGAPVSVAVKGASMSTVLGGYQLDVPWVVYACVEELNRTGIYQPGLFRAVPNRTRLARLIDAFDLPCPAYAVSPDEDDMCPKVAPTASVTRASLRKESMPDICALLKTYLDLLPEPLLDANLASALYTLCVKPCLAREDEMDEMASDSDGGYFASHSHARARSAPPVASSSHMSLDVPMTPSEHRNAQLSLEAPQILLAQHILRLAPPHALALLAYLLGFFTQLPLCPDNGMDFADVARMFGRVLVGGPRADADVVRECVRWLLERWTRVSDGLFDVVPPEERAGESESAPASACKTSFGTFPQADQHPCPPLSSREATPRQLNDLGQAGVAMARVRTETQARAQMPYDPGLVGPLAPIQTFFRPHSTSVSSDGSTSSSATSESFEMDQDIGGVYENAKDDVGAMVGEFVVPDERALYDPFDRNARIATRYGLVEREYVSCPSSPHHRAFSDTRLSSPATSVRSLEVDGSSWPSSSSSEATSRCSPPPPSYTLDGDGPQNERTPRNSTSY
ncbi:Rho GTPase activation protein [Cubamyces sp. BRFM 1775]|nr:Rho GTPase activation protein [Cubamyces sp. BRFM 1775]